MSIIHFIATSDTKLTKTEFDYKDFIPDMDKSLLYSAFGISFVDEKHMDDAEISTVKGVFQQCNVYAVRSACNLHYRVDYNTGLSPEVARYHFEELVWFKNFIKKLLKKNDEVFVIRLDLGYPTKLGKLKSLQVGIDRWTLDKEKDFMFEYGIMYQFVKNSVQENVI